jgi:hypothetical protein
MSRQPPRERPAARVAAAARPPAGDSSGGPPDNLGQVALVLAGVVGGIFVQSDDRCVTSGQRRAERMTAIPQCEVVTSFKLAESASRQPMPIMPPSSRTRVWGRWTRQRFPEQPLGISACRTGAAAPEVGDAGVQER